MPIPTAPRRIPATGRAQVRLIEKAGKPVMVVYDESGKAVGTVDPAKIQPLAQAAGDGPSQAEIDANAARVKGEMVAGEVQKAVAAALGGLRAAPVPAGQIRKAAANLDEQYGQLLKTVDSGRADKIRAAVAMGALKLMIEGVARDKPAVQIAKRVACEVAVNKRLI